MIDLKKYNYFTGDNIGHVSRGVSIISDFLELAGSNYVLFTPDFKSTLYHHFDNKIIFSNLFDFIDKISNKSNLFRLDFIVFDFWHLNKDTFWLYKNEIDDLNINAIIVSREYGYSDSEDVNDFSLRYEYKKNPNSLDDKSDIWLSDNINKTSTTLEYLKISYIRDKKLEYLFGDSKDIC